MTSLESSGTRRSSLPDSTLGSVLTSQTMPVSSTSEKKAHKARLLKNGIARPTIYEKQFGESLKFRSAQLEKVMDMGPADLVHISRYHRHSKQEEGEYHYCIGIDTSSLIQPFIYLQTVVLSEKSKGTEKHPEIGTYCCYNCFRHGDLHIRHSFPGAAAPLVQFFPCDSKKVMITLNTEETDLAGSIWRETYVSGLVRAILFSDSIERQLPGMCKFNPVPSTKDAKEAVNLMCSMLPKGPILGCNDITNSPTLCENYLVEALLQLLKLVQLHDLALQNIESLEENSQFDFSVLKAQILLDKGEQQNAVRLMYDVLKTHSRNGWMLQKQAEFLLGKNRPDLALIPAMKAVECLPTEFRCWRTLIKTYILQKDFKNALLTLNSSPMYSNRKKDTYPALKPKDFNFLYPSEGKIPSVWQDCETFGCISGYGGIVEFSPANQINSLSPLHAEVYEQTKLQATFKEAYNLLAIMTRQLGWTELLRIRSEIFVMDDEYNASVEMEKKKELDRNLAAQRATGLELKARIDGSSSNSSTNNTSGETTSRSTSKNSANSLSRISTRFRKKWLSERWLDSLFLIFYENMKSVLIWENERRGQDEIEHSALEWELIGNECFDVHHYESGVVPFQTSLGDRFSVFGCIRLLRYYLLYTQNLQQFRILNRYDKMKTPKYSQLSPYMLSENFVLTLVCKLISWNYRYYGEFSVLCLEVLRQLMNLTDSDSTFIKSKIAVLFSEEKSVDKEGDKLMSPKKEGRRASMERCRGVSVIADRLIAWLEQFND